MVSVLTGLLAGATHVLAGPDHLAAVAPFAAERPRSKWRIGIRWGLGHSSGVILVGLMALVLRDLLPMELLSSWAERLVGVLLVGIGLWGIRGALTSHVHSHEHSHDGRAHTHFHFHLAPQVRRHVHNHAAFVIGILHGFAGGAHFLGVLPALAFPTVLEGASYLACYGVGTVASMAAFSGAIGLLTERFAQAGSSGYKVCMLGFSVTAVLVGVFWLGY